MVKVFIYKLGKVASVYEEEATFLIAKELACLPEDVVKAPELTEEKALKKDYSNKAIKPKKNK